MEYVFRCLFGFAMTFIGCELAILITCRRITRYKQELKLHRERLTKPESYIWVDVDDHLPVHNREYLVEYRFEKYPDVRFHSVHDFDIRENRFQHEGFEGLKVVRWAELPR